MIRKMTKEEQELKRKLQADGYQLAIKPKEIAYVR